jgi:glutathione S-transferase
MILYGQYDSPFVRRVGVAMELYDFAFEHHPWSVFGDAERLAAVNPLRRVPALALEGGETLIDSAAILDALDDLVGEARALVPARGPHRRAVLKVCALGSGLADKAVSLVYERAVHGRATPAWEDRCRRQIGDVLAVLEDQRAASPGPWWFGERPTHADIMVGCALTFLGEAHPDMVDPDARPTLAAHAARCEAMPVFQRIRQPFHVVPPAGPAADIDA